MKQIKETDKKTTIVLEDGDVLEIVSLKGNNEKILIQCIHTSLHVDEIPLYEIEQLQEEKKAIEAMKNYLEKNEKEN